MGQGVVDDELAEGRVAADVAFCSCVQRLWVDHTDDIAEIQIAVGDRGDVLAAVFAEISFIAFGHDGSLATGCEGVTRRCACHTGPSHQQSM